MGGVRSDKAFVRCYFPSSSRLVFIYVCNFFRIYAESHIRNIQKENLTQKKK